MKLNYPEYFRYGPRVFWKRNTLPMYLIFFVTSRCNARCGHCFNWKRAAAEVTDLTVDEYRQISAHMPNLVFMFFSGGEAFLRDDFAEIVQLFHKNNRVQKAQTPSNGSMTDSMRRKVETILRACPDLHYSVTLAVDALGEEHDKIRAFPGLFERVMETYRVLKELTKRYDNFGINFEITVSKYNQDSLVETYRFLRERCDAQNVFSVLTRGAPRDPAAAEVDLERYRELNRVMEADILARNNRGYFGFPFASWMNAKNLYSREIVYRTARDREFQIPCFAGQLSGNVFNNGDVYPCELLDRPFGNLRENGYDLPALWRSATGDAIRRHIRDTKCFCTHECFLNCNLFFNWRNLPHIAARRVRIATGGRLFGG
jgi:MoaA/NifB/PqqE/SkfB family radical SAM enzyme